LHAERLSRARTPARVAQTRCAETTTTTTHSNTTTTTNTATPQLHPNGNPHHWLDPENAKLIATNIYKHAARLDPDNEAEYKKRLSAFVNRINMTKSALKGGLKKISGAKIVTYHKSFSNFAAWTGINVVATVEPKPGIPPNSKHVDELMQLIPRAGVKVILVENYYPHKVPDYLAEKTGVKVLVVPNTTGASGINTYDALMRHLVTTIAEEL
jgi:zinc/manganese transport system substrate-binding protein